ncbi:MAG: cupin domain-containing protein [Aquificae bacterium]|nr:cupin domain-containing protein [Aquificota bacterium]
MEGVKLTKTGITDKESAREFLERLGYSVYEWYDPPGTVYPTHTHPGAEARLVLEGEVTIGVGDREITLKPGDLIELEPELPHRARTEKGVRYLCGSK